MRHIKLLAHCQFKTPSLSASSLVGWLTLGVFILTHHLFYFFKPLLPTTSSSPVHSSATTITGSTTTVTETATATSSAWSTLDLLTRLPINAAIAMIWYYLVLVSTILAFFSLCLNVEVARVPVEVAKQQRQAQETAAKEQRQAQQTTAKEQRQAQEAIAKEQTEAARIEKDKAVEVGQIEKDKAVEMARINNETSKIEKGKAEVELKKTMVQAGMA